MLFQIEEECSFRLTEVAKEGDEKMSIKLLVWRDYAKIGVKPLSMPSVC